jgi:hypothetical protein
VQPPDQNVNWTQSLYETLPESLIEQAPHQLNFTSCLSNGIFNDRPACQRTDVFGNVNGQFGGCASFTGFFAFSVVAYRLQLVLPDRLKYLPENLIRIYDEWGNNWDREQPGVGKFREIFLNLINVVLRDETTWTPTQRELLQSLTGQFSEFWIEPTDRSKRGGDALLTVQQAVARYFGSRSMKQFIPIEAVMDGWVLDHAPKNYCPIRDAIGQCDLVRGWDQRAAHSALIVGRRMRAGVCEIQIRNSWKGTCRKGHYANSNRECDAQSDSVWIKESELLEGLSAVKMFN